MEFPPSRRPLARTAWFPDKLGAETGKNKDFGPRARATDSLVSRGAGIARMERLCGAAQSGEW
jgi:hypothetical protein